ncbi:hypothetical protein [Cyanobium sp. Candia 9D4]|nr:hypothetical protein [Cyanobium sp. Candia 9D4]
MPKHEDIGFRKVIALDEGRGELPEQGGSENQTMVGQAIIGGMR